MDESFLADVPQEGDNDPFAALEKDTPTDSPAEIEPEAEAPEEKPAPFDEHPRWKQRMAELHRLEKVEEEHTREIAELRAFKEQATTHTNIPEWFKELYGENEIAYQKYEQHERQKEEQIEQRVIEKQQRQAKEAQDNVAYWNNWVEDQLLNLKAQGEVFDDNELKATMKKFRPTDENNNLDFKAGLEIYRAMKPKEDPARSQARKQLADTTTHASPAGESAKRDYLNANDLRGRSWGSL